MSYNLADNETLILQAFNESGLITLDACVDSDYLARIVSDKIQQGTGYFIKPGDLLGKNGFEIVVLLEKHEQALQKFINSEELLIF